MESHISGPDYFIIIGYFALMLGIGAYFYRYMSRLKDMFSGGNQIPWWLSGVSFYMTSFSVFGFIAYSAVAYKYGWVGVTIFHLHVPATLVSVLFFAKKWRRARIDSPVEYLENRYSPLIRQIFAWQGVPVKLIDDGLKMVATGVFMSKAFNLDLMQSMIWSGAIILVYTLMGGLWAVTVTDFIQFVIMAAAVLMLVPLSFAKVDSLSAFIKNSPEHFFSFIHPEYDWLYFFSTLLLYILSFSSINWSLIQKYYCVPTEKDAHKVGWTVIALQLIGPPLILLPAMLARQFLPNITDDAQVYPTICMYLLPTGLIGLIIVAMFGATMSTLSGDYNVCAGVLTSDVYKRLIRPTASQKELVLVGRLMTLVIGLVVLGISYFMVRSTGEGLMRNMFTLFSIATAPVAIPMIAGLFTKKVSEKAALFSFLAGIIVGIIIFLLMPDEFIAGGIKVKTENLLLWATTITSVLTIIICSRLLPSAKNQKVEQFFLKLQSPIGSLEEDRASAGVDIVRMSAFKIVGICIMIIAAMLFIILPFIKGVQEFRLNLVFAVILVIIGILMTFSTSKSLKLTD